MPPSSVELSGQQRGGARIPPEAAVCVEGSPQGASKPVTLAAELPVAPRSGPACGEGQCCHSTGTGRTSAATGERPLWVGPLSQMERTALVLATRL